MAKSTSVLRGMRDIRTIAGTKKGSIPRRRESPYLRLHMLWTNNDRLSREYASAEKRRLSLERRMEENRDESARLALGRLTAHSQQLTAGNPESGIRSCKPQAVSRKPSRSVLRRRIKEKSEVRCQNF